MEEVGEAYAVDNGFVMIVSLDTSTLSQAAARTGSKYEFCKAVVTLENYRRNGWKESCT